MPPASQDVAVYLLGLDNAQVPHPTLPSSFQGVVFIDDEGSKKILLRPGARLLENMILGL